ncbi:MAG: hypothetical protein JST00_33180 [Deltaproteobacteria bacterium]|nr:hypothetical protein [Deltaproteobacteria bacterium]
MAHDSHAHGPPPPPEPKTPMWLPAVGAVLFLMVGLFWALSDSTPETKDSQPGSAPAATATAAAKPAGHP